MATSLRRVVLGVLCRCVPCRCALRFAGYGQGLCHHFGGCLFDGSSISAFHGFGSFGEGFLRHDIATHFAAGTDQLLAGRLYFVLIGLSRAIRPLPAAIPAPNNGAITSRTKRSSRLGMEIG